MRALLILSLTLLSFVTIGQVIYPYELKYFPTAIRGKTYTMAFMDERPANANGKTVLLFHGKNFSGFYWKDVMTFLLSKGYRVIAPDQIGWGRSEKPIINYSFDMLAENTIQLLDSLNINRVNVLAHSMGGMLATKFTINYPARVEKLILENPIGLEDYKSFVPQQPVEDVFQKELHATYESYKKYQQSYYPVWKPEYEVYVRAQAESLKEPDFRNTAYVNALTFRMINDQPVVDDFKKIKVPTLLIIGLADQTVVGKDQLTEEKRNVYGNYPELGSLTNKKIKGSILIELSGVGHIPHIQTPELFNQHVLRFLESKLSAALTK